MNNQNKSNLFAPSPMRKERSDIVRRSLLSKTNKISQSDVDKAKSHVEAWNKKSKENPKELETRFISITKSIGLGSRRNIIGTCVISTSPSDKENEQKQKFKEYHQNKYPEQFYENRSSYEEVKDDWEIMKRNNGCPDMHGMFTKSEENKGKHKQRDLSDTDGEEPKANEEFVEESTGCLDIHGVFTKREENKGKQNEKYYPSIFAEEQKNNEEFVQESTGCLDIHGMFTKSEENKGIQNEKKYPVICAEEIKAKRKTKVKKNQDACKINGGQQKGDQGDGLKNRIEAEKEENHSGCLVGVLTRSDTEDSETLLDLAADAADRSLTVIWNSTKSSFRRLSQI